MGPDMGCAKEIRDREKSASFNHDQAQALMEKDQASH